MVVCGVSLAVLTDVLARANSLPICITTFDVVDQIIWPHLQGNGPLCTHSSLPESSRGPASCFVSHAWGGIFSHLVDVVAQFESRNPNTFFWVDIFCIQQENPRKSVSDSKNTDEHLQRFENVIKAVSNLVLVASPWDNPMALGRIWCVWELYNSVVQRKRGLKLEILIPRQLYHELSHFIQGESDLKGLILKVDVRNARASFDNDKDVILARISVAGIEEVNCAIQDVLRNEYLVHCQDLARLLAHELEEESNFMSDVSLRCIMGAGLATWPTMQVLDLLHTRIASITSTWWAFQIATSVMIIAMLGSTAFVVMGYFSRLSYISTARAVEQQYARTTLAVSRLDNSIAADISAIFSSGRTNGTLNSYIAMFSVMAVLIYLPLFVDQFLLPRAPTPINDRYLRGLTVYSPLPILLLALVRMWRGPWDHALLVYTMVYLVPIVFFFATLDVSTNSDYTVAEEMMDFARYARDALVDAWPAIAMGCMLIWYHEVIGLVTIFGIWCGFLFFIV